MKKKIIIIASLIILISLSLILYFTSIKPFGLIEDEKYNGLLDLENIKEIKLDVSISYPVPYLIKDADQIKEFVEYVENLKVRKKLFNSSKGVIKGGLILINFKYSDDTYKSVELLGSEYLIVTNINYSTKEIISEYYKVSDGYEELFEFINKLKPVDFTW